MDLIKKYLKSFGESDSKNTTLRKSGEDMTDSLEGLLNKVDQIADLRKSAIPENATADAREDAAEATETVFSVEKTLAEIEAAKKKAKDGSIPENATANAAADAAESTETVFTVVKPLEAMPGKKVQAEVALHKAEKEEEEVEDEDSEEDKEEDKKEKKAGDKLMKSAGVKEEDLEVFDVAAPLADLKKGFDAMATVVAAQTQTISELKDLFKSLLEVQVKGYSLQKNMADTMDSYSGQVNTPKGVVNILHKNFVQNESTQEAAPSIKEFTDVLFKGLSSGKVDVSVASQMISSAEATSVLTPKHIELYKSLK